MFRVRHPAPREAQSRLLAGYLAGLAGLVNSAGVVLIGVFTSHVTGNVGRFATDVGTLHFGAAGSALALIAAFFVGAFVANLVVESPFFAHRERAIAVVLFGEASMLLAFVAVSWLPVSTAGARGMDVHASVLCVAMGMQNSLITRLSGAVVRTTHLTGVVTDLGIEAAHWFRWWRGMLSAPRPGSAQRPDGQKVTLLLVIAGAFTVGAVLGASMAPHLGRNVMFLPALGLVACALYALQTARKSASGRD